MGNPAGIANGGFDLIDDLIARFPNPLAAGEEQAIREFIKREQDAGRDDNYEQLWCFAFQDQANSLHPWLLTTPEATLNGGVVHVAGQGFDMNATNGNYITTGHLLGVDGAAIATAEDAFVNVHIGSDVAPGVGVKNVVDTSADPNLSRIFLQLRPSSVSRAALNAEFLAYSLANEGPDQLRGIIKGGGRLEQYIDGLFVQGQPQTAIQLTELPINIGNNSGATLDGIIRGFWVGTHVGFNHLGAYDSWVTFLTDIGALP